MTTLIEWTDETWNPVTGCTKVSQGCKNCYAERIAERFWGDRKFTDVQCHEDRLEIPLHWRKPRRIFVNSMSDLFHDAVPDSFIADILHVIGHSYCAQHTFQVLTKRPRRMYEFFASNPGAIIPNLQLGVSAENQETLDERIPWLLKTPAAVRFVSYEPALGPMDFKSWLSIDDSPAWSGGVDWVIAGGESGPGARPMHPDWARSVRDQCQAAGVPFFFKQWGEWALKGSVNAKSRDFGVMSPDGTWYHQHTGWNGRPIDPDTNEAYMLNVGKKAAGRLLDGREWNEYPGVQP